MRRWAKPGLVLLGLILDWLAIPPGPLPAAILAADAPFLWLLFSDGGRRWKRWAFLYGFLHFGAALWWVGYVAWGHPFMMVMFVVVVAAFLGVLYVPLGALIRSGARRRAPWLILVPTAMVLEEWARTVWLGGMPWPTRSMSFAGSDRLVASSSLLGAYALSFLAAASSAVVAGVPSLLRAPSGVRGALAGRLAIAALFPLLLAGFLYNVGGNRIGGFARRRLNGEVATTRPFVSIQGNIAQGDKLAATMRDEADDVDAGDVANRVFQRHVRLSKTALASLAAEDPMAVLWPETMIPWDFVDPAVARAFPDVWANEVRVLTHVGPTTPPGTNPLFLLGAIHVFARGGKVESDYGANGKSDSLFLVDPSQLPRGREEPEPPPVGQVPVWELGRHDKVALVPGGEYTPLGDWVPPLRWLRNWLSPNIPELDAGDPEQAPLVLTRVARERRPEVEVRAGTVVCFEVVFPAHTRSWRRRGAHVLLNAANYAWFGATPMRAQIEAIARLRAAETGTTIVMAGNQGPTMFFDPVGRPYGEFRDASGEEVVPIGSMATTLREGWAVGPLAADPDVPTYVRSGDVPWAVLALLLAARTLLRRRSVPGAPGATPGGGPAQPPPGSGPASPAPAAPAAPDGEMV